MPSENMIRYPIDLYPNQDKELKRIMRNHRLKRSRFLRECVKYVLESRSRTGSVVKNCDGTNYVKKRRRARAQ